MIRAVDEVPIEKLREMMERGDAVKLLLEQLPFLKPVLDKAEVERVLGKQVQDGQEVESWARSSARWLRIRALR